MIKTRKISVAPSSMPAFVKIAQKQVQWLCEAASRSMDLDQESLDGLEAETTKMLDCFEFDNLLVDVQMNYNSFICTVACGIRIDDPFSPTSDWHLFSVAFVPTR